MRMLRLFLCSLSIAGACGRPASAPLEVAAGQSIQLRTEETASVAGTPVRVQFTRAADSRCPSDVVCITAGEAVIELVFSGSGATEGASLRLGQKPVTATYGGLVFEATALDPYPRSNQPSATQTLTLRVTTASSS